VAIASLAALALTILGIQLWGQVREQLRQANAEPITATVVQCPSVVHGAAKDARAFTSPAVLSIREQVTAPEMLRQAWADVKSQATVADVARFRRALGVEVAVTPMDEKCLKLTLSWRDSQEGAKLLKALGDRFCARYRATLDNANVRQRDATMAACEQAGRVFDEAVADLLIFEQCLAWQTVAAEEVEQRPAEIIPPPAENVAHPLRSVADVENPDWIDLQKQLVELRKTAVKLLVKRTQLHPEVQFVEGEIRECETKLAMTARWVPKEEPAGPAAVSTPEMKPAVVRVLPKEPNDSAAQRAQTEALNTEFLAAFESQAQAAAAAYQRALSREVASMGQRVDSPELAVRVRTPPQIAVLPPARPPFVWLAGAMMALGVGLVFTGKSIEPPVGSAEELQRIAAVPVVGVVPDYDPTVDPQDIKSRMTFLRMGFVCGGLMLAGVCVWVITRIV
jgi:hypothetical protein